MAKKLDAERIEQARHKNEGTSRRELEKKLIKETIAQNRSGERKGRVIMPERKEYVFQEAAKVRV
ncbi:recombinase family protein, partial [bacterium]|nr:recombinase family protein [bacterium]